MKRVPSFWWDFEEGAVIVESDIDMYPVGCKYCECGDFEERTDVQTSS